MKRSSRTARVAGTCNDAVYRRAGLRDAAGIDPRAARERNGIFRTARIREMAVALVTLSLATAAKPPRNRLSFRLRGGRNKRSSNYAALVSTSMPRCAPQRDSSEPDRANSFSFCHFVLQVIFNFYSKTLEKSVCSIIKNYFCNCLRN